MTNLEKILHGLSSCGTDYGIPNICEVTECPYRENKAWCVHALACDARMLITELLKAQEPRLITNADFENKELVDSSGSIPAWVEYRRGEEWDEYNDEQNDEWAVIYQFNFKSEFYRCWTSRPDEKRRAEIPWE